MTTVTHHFGAHYSINFPQIIWTYDKQTDPKKCSVYEGDKIEFAFHSGPNEAQVGEWALIAGPLNSKENWTPFKEGNNVDLKLNPTVTVLKDAGTWGFCMMLSVRTPSGTLFFLSPDPELQVGPKPRE